MGPPINLSVFAVLKWIVIETAAVIALVAPTTWLAANYFYNHLHLIDPHDTNATVMFITVLACAETVLFCPIMIVPISATLNKLRLTQVWLEALANADALTGLLNRRGFDNAVAELKTEYPNLAPVAALICDIDFFKRANDDFGHDFGDVALRELGALIRGLADANNAIAARFGGEEFVLLTPGMPAFRVMSLAESLRISFQARTVEHAGARSDLTISIGVAFADDLGDLPALLASADAALYEAKRAGRNQVIREAQPKLRSAA